MTASNHAQCFSRSLARSSRADLRFVNGTTWLALAHALLPWADMGQAATNVFLLSGVLDAAHAPRLEDLLAAGGGTGASFRPYLDGRWRSGWTEGVTS